MSNKSIILNTNRPGFFTPQIKRSSADSTLAASQLRERTFKSFENTNLQSSSSFRYGDKIGLVSTQQLPVDYSKFENHTFFHSAIAKVNESFDKIINYYPYDASNKGVEAFEDELTGFEKHVLNSFPKNVGYLIFSGTKVGETSGGTFLSIKDSVGSEYTSLASVKSGKTLLNPNLDPFSFEFYINVPEEVNDNQIILQKNLKGSIANGMTLALSHSNSSTACDLIFGITSGSGNLYVTSSIQKGRFNHIFAGYDRDNDQKIHIISNGDFKSKSSSPNAYEFDKLLFINSDFLIGSGSSVRLNGSSQLFLPKQTLSASMDEFRYYRSYLDLNQINKFIDSNLDFNKDDKDKKLILYFKFNEPYGTYDGNNLVLDSSGNSFNTSIKNFIVENRLTSSLDLPLRKENVNRSPVLFPSFPEIINLNDSLMVTASLYDDFNPNLITKLVPSHYFEEGNKEEDFNEVLGTFNDLKLTGGSSPGISQIKSSQQLTIFLLVWSKFFDELKLFVDAFSNLKNLSYDEFDSIPDPLLRKAGEMQGIKLPALFKNSNIDQLFEGVDLNKDPVKSQKPLIEIQNIVWKRILASLPFIRTTKGTIESVKSIFKSSGIDPENLFLIREYGGSFERRIDKIKETKKDVIRLLKFSGSNSTESQTLDTQGRPDKKPTLKSNFLSGSRIEIGEPKIRRVFATGEVDFKSNNVADYHSNRIDLISTKNKLVRYTFDSSASVTTGDVFESGGFSFTKVGINGLSTKAQIAAQFKAAVEHVNGHGGEITVNLSNAVAQLKQAHADGFVANGSNSTIVKTGMANSIVTVTGFSGGFGFEKEGNDNFHGISTNKSDGLFTTSSFTIEGQYKFNINTDNPATQSLMRLHVTGNQLSSQYESAIANLIYNDKSNQLSLFFIDAPNPSNSTPFQSNELVINNINMFDSDLWNISFGFNSGEKTGNPGTGSLFLRAGKSFGGQIEELLQTSSFYDRVLDSGNPTSLFSNIRPDLNASGTFIAIGSQSLGGGTHNTFINDENIDSYYKHTNFTGELGSLRFWSKELSEEEWKSHLRNPMNFGTNNPEKSYLFESIKSGSFEKLRLQTFTKQKSTGSDNNGAFRYFDFSHNNIHLEGQGFEPNKTVVGSEHIIFNTMSPYFDLSIADKKVRVRSLADVSRRDENPYALTTPVYEVFPGERTLDDPRFSIEMSVMKGLNDDIIKIFSDYDYLEKSIGKTNLLFAEKYPDLIQIRKLYFENVLENLDIGKYRELFKWIDNSFTDIIAGLLPHTTKFMGINFVYENHMLERNRFKYLFDEIYLKSKPIVSDRSLSLSQFVAILKRM